VVLAAEALVLVLDRLPAGMLLYTKDMVEAQVLTLAGHTVLEVVAVLGL
jgi:hypothetical protein